MTYTHHVIRNLGKHPTIFKRIKATALFNIGSFRFWRRPPFLTEKDYKDSVTIIRAGDIVLVGNHHKLVAFYMRGIVTHSLLYVGNGECIHAHGEGVERIAYRELFDVYDTLIVIRINTSEDCKARAVAWMRNKLGLPFDYDFNTSSREEWFCTKLVCGAYHHVDTDLLPFSAKRLVFPQDLLSGIGTRVFHSESLRENGGKLTLNPDFYRSALLRAVIVSESSR